MTCELAPAFPEPSGSVAWVSYAFGPFWGWMKGYLSWLSGVTDNRCVRVCVCVGIDDRPQSLLSMPIDHPTHHHHLLHHHPVASTRS